MENLVRPRKFSSKLLELPIYKRITLNYPILVRKAVAVKLASVASKLPKGIRLQIDSGYRDVGIQKILWETRYKQNLKQFDAEKAKQATNKFVKNPEEEVPTHATGGAVDVSLVDKNGKENSI